MNNIDKIKVLTLSGSYISLQEWQQKYGLEVGSTNIGKYFKYTESEFAENLRIQGQLIVCEPLMMVMDRTRELNGKPLRVNSFNRSEAEQVALKESYSRAAVTSPHVAKVAVDFDTDSKLDTQGLVVEIREAAKQLNIKVRIGWKDYMDDGKTFVHVDVCPEYYAKGKPFHQFIIDNVKSNPKLQAWTKKTEW